MRALRLLIGLAVLVSTGPAMTAEGDARPGDINPADVVQHLPSMPARGSTKASVRDRLGEPNRRIGPVGDPPISQWVYEEFTVYFEYDRVLHSVKHRDR